MVITGSSSHVHGLRQCQTLAEGTQTSLFAWWYRSCTLPAIEWWVALSTRSSPIPIPIVRVSSIVLRSAVFFLVHGICVTSAPVAFTRCRCDGPPMTSYPAAIHTPAPRASIIMCSPGVVPPTTFVGAGRNMPPTCVAIIISNLGCLAPSG